MEPLRNRPFELFFGDEMRYGLISNFRRSWSKVGERTVIDSQQSYENRYLFSAVAPLSGDSSAAHTFLLELKKRHPASLVILVGQCSVPPSEDTSRDTRPHCAFSATVLAGVKPNGEIL